MTKREKIGVARPKGRPYRGSAEASVHIIGVMTSAEELSAVSDQFIRRLSIGRTGGHCVSCQKLNGYFGSESDRMNRRYPGRGIGSSGDTQIFC